MEIEANVFRIDIWNAEKIKFYIENTLVNEYLLANNDQYTSANLCGLNTKDEGIISVKFSSPQLNNRLNLMIESTSLNGEWGIRDLQIKIYKCHSACAFCNGPTNTDCLLCGTGKFLYQGTCIDSCPAKTIRSTKSITVIGNNIDGQECLVCASGCSTCTGPQQNQCLTCDYPLLLNGISKYNSYISWFFE